MALDIKTINFASYLNDQGMLYSTYMEHRQTMDRHKISCTVLIYPDPNNPMNADRHIKCISESTYFDSAVREATLDALKLAFPSQWIHYEAKVASA